MNKTTEMILLLIFAFTVTISAQQSNNSKVPENVIKAFQTAYPHAQDVTWDQEGQNFEANYKMSDTSYSALINNLGKILETEREITPSELPSGVIKYVSDNYKGYMLNGAALIKDESGNITYEAEIAKGNAKKDVLFDQNGKPLPHKKSGKSEEKEDEDND